MDGPNSSWAPNETSATIYAEETWLQGNLLSNIAYGVELTLFVMCFTILVRQLNRFNYKRQMLLLIFISVIFVLGTVFMGAQAKFTQMAFIEYRNFPGGPSAYENAEYSVPVDEIANVCFIVGNWLMDAFLVWRFMVIYKEVGRGWVTALMVLPCLMLCASVALGITVLVTTSTSSPFAQVQITLAYYVMSLALNVIVTLLIVGRLLHFRRRIVRALGPDHVSTYANIVSILVESASLYSVFALLFLVPFGLGNNLGNVFLQTVSQVQTISSLLIIFRVATGKAWTGETGTRVMTSQRAGGSTVRLKKLTSMQFASNMSTAVDSVDSKPGSVGITVSHEVTRDPDMDSNV